MPKSAASMAFANDVFREFETPARAVDAVLLWQLAAWRLAAEGEDGDATDSVRAKGGKGRILSTASVVERVKSDESVRGLLDEFGSEAVTNFSERLVVRLSLLGLAWKTKPNRYGEEKTVISLKALEPMRLIRTLFGCVLTDSEIRFLVFASIRRRYKCTLSSETARVIHTLADGVNRHLIATARAKAEQNGRPHRLTWHFKDEFLPALRNLTSAIAKQPEAQRRALRVFVGACRAVNYIQLDQRSEHLVCRTREIDAEYLTSALFGLPTNIQGFDQLFGGGGLMLVEDPPFAAVEQSPSGEADDVVFRKRARICGRAVLVTGRYSTGKSLLSMQVAVEVARHGGIAWVLALEQSPEECLYTLQSMRVLPNDGSIAIATNAPSAFSILDKADAEKRETGPVWRQHPRRGALVFVQAEKSDYRRFLATLRKPAEWAKLYPLRLIVVDPLNAIDKGQEPNIAELRTETLQLFEDIKATGTNIWFNAEHTAIAGSSFFEQNIADTVIHLSADSQDDGNVQRYIEVQKSRLQREQRGKHPFEIVSGVGIRIFPSSSAVSNRIRSRTPRMPEQFDRFGLESLDSILGERAIGDNDIILLHGPSGCFKTLLGLHFLSYFEQPDMPSRQWLADRRLKRKNLLFVTGDAELRVRWLVDQKRRSDHGASTNFHLESLPDGHVQPGEILHGIEQAIAGLRNDNHAISRIAITNVVHWQINCPYLACDKIFGTTLIELLRRQNVAALLTCDSDGPKHFPLEAALVEAADCIIECDRVESRGKSEVTLRVVKTRGMRHRREWFELYGGPEPLEVRSVPSLMRVSADGTVSRIPVRLFLHSETEMQDDYYQTVLRSLMAVLSRNVKIEAQRGIILNDVLGMGRYSVLDELQVVQLDEHQFPTDAIGAELLRRPAEFWNSDEMDRSDLLDRLKARLDPGQGTIGAPFFGNISLLAWREGVNESCVRDWHSLADESDRWTSHNSDGIFFDFVKLSGENYNCLFLEILLALSPHLKSPERSCSLHDWLGTKEAVEAMVLFRRLCARPHSARKRQLFELAAEPMLVDEDAYVWRHWYSTLNQMLARLTPAVRAKVRVGPLPGDVTIAGEWFLAVPAYSAAPELAVEIVRRLTTRDAELDRMRRGVGLPSRASFYVGDGLDDVIETPMSPYFSMSIHTMGKLVNNAFCRSRFGCYSQLSSVLTAHLQRMVEASASTEGHARAILSSLRSRVEFLALST